MVDEFSQAQVPGEGGRHEQAGIGHQAMVVKEDADTVGFVLWQRGYWVLLVSARVSVPKPLSQLLGAPSSFFMGCPQGRHSVDSG